MPNLLDDEPLPFASEDLDKFNPEYHQDFHKWKADPSPGNANQLLSKMQPTIDRAVYTYAGPNASPSLKGQAKLMALKSFHTFDPNRGNLKTHILSQLQSLQRTNRQENQMISIPERVSLDSGLLRNAEDELSDNLGRPPNDAELADHLGLSLGRIAHIRSAKPGTNTGSMLDDEGEEYIPASDIPGRDTKEEAVLHMIYHDIGDTDKLIFEHTLGFNNKRKLSTGQLAVKLGLTPGAVSQRKLKIQNMVDEMRGYL